MADETSLPYINATGYIPKVLNKIKEAETPTRFSYDFLATTLQMPGGSPRAIVPFLKRIGFLGGDGTPTELYKKFRGAQSGAAAAEALRIGYRPLYRINEYAHDAKDQKLRELIVQATGAEKNAKRVGAIAASFEALKKFADFSSATTNGAGPAAPAADTVTDGGGSSGGLAGSGIAVGYTINLNLPPTSDVAVFDAIFRSLKEHLL
jgi:hypothetical protein